METASRAGADPTASRGPASGGSASRSVQRALDVFDLLLARGQPVTVADLVASLHIPKSSAYELVRTLADNGYLERRPGSGAYGLGRRLYELGMAYRSQIDLLKEGGRVVEELCHETGETVQLSVLEDGMMLVLLKEESRHPIRIISRIGSRVPVNWAAAGHLLVSDLDDEALHETLERHVTPSPTGAASTDIDQVIARIRAFRAQGYGFELGEANAHAGCVAAPVTDGSAKCVAVISIVAPEQRLRVEHRSVLIAADNDAARRLSHRLGAP